MPLLNSQVLDMDEARMSMIEKLQEYIASLKEETRRNELILESIVHSLSAQNENARNLANSLAESRTEHLPQVRKLTPPPKLIDAQARTNIPSKD